MRFIDHIVIHHSASSRSTTTEEIRQWHLGRGWQDVGYHLLIEGGGMVVPGRPFESPGAHVKGHNMYTLGICVIGDNTNTAQSWRDNQVKALGNALQILECVYPDAIVCGHRDMPDTATECPGLDVRKLLGLEPLEKEEAT
jgi:N-acetylmuramoyl-L-alanine amidase